MCYPNETWLQALPMVLLGIRTSIKEDLHASPAELVYGEPLRVPGDLLTTSAPADAVSTPELLHRLRRQMADLRPVPGTRHAKPHSFVFKDLSTCTHVFLRDDTVHRSLQKPYTGPHQVISRDDKTITLLIKGKESRVSLDRVKPAYVTAPDGNVYTKPAPPAPPARTASPTTPIPAPPGATPETAPATTRPDSTHPSALSDPHYTTRSGRRVRFRFPPQVRFLSPRRSGVASTPHRPRS